METLVEVMEVFTAGVETISLPLTEVTTGCGVGSGGGSSGDGGSSGGGGSGGGHTRSCRYD